MFNFDTCVVHLGFTAILGDPKFGAMYVGSPHCIALAAYTWLTLVINCNNEVCSPSNDAILRAFWQKKVQSLQRISCCGVISYKIMHTVRAFAVGMPKQKCITLCKACPLNCYLKTIKATEEPSNKFHSITTIPLCLMYCQICFLAWLTSHSKNNKYVIFTHHGHVLVNLY